MYNILIMRVSPPVGQFSTSWRRFGEFIPIIRTWKKHYNTQMWLQRNVQSNNTKCKDLFQNVTNKIITNRPLINIVCLACIVMGIMNTNEVIKSRHIYNIQIHESFEKCTCYWNALCVTGNMWMIFRQKSETKKAHFLIVSRIPGIWCLAYC